MRMRQIVLICGLGAALMAGMAQAIEKQDSFQAVQYESVQAVAVDASPVVALAGEIAAVPVFRVETAVEKTAIGVGAGASNTGRMRQSFTAEQNEPFSIASVTSQAKAPDKPGEEYWL